MPNVAYSDMAITEDEILAAIEDGIQTVASDGVSTSLVDPLRRIQALKALRDLENGVEAAKQPAFGLRFTKLVPPGGG